MNHCLHIQLLSVKLLLEFIGPIDLFPIPSTQHSKVHHESDMIWFTAPSSSAFLKKLLSCRHLNIDQCENDSDKTGESTPGIGVWQDYADFILACRYAAWSPLAITWLQLLATTSLQGLSPSGITLELNWSQLHVVCRGGQSAAVIDLLARHCLLIPLWQMALAQLYKYHHQSGKVVSGKLVWKQHKGKDL